MASHGRTAGSPSASRPRRASMISRSSSARSLGSVGLWESESDDGFESAEEGATEEKSNEQLEREVAVVMEKVEARVPAQEEVEEVDFADTFDMTTESFVSQTSPSAPFGPPSLLPLALPLPTPSPLAASKPPPTAPTSPSPIPRTSPATRANRAPPPPPLSTSPSTAHSQKLVSSPSAASPSHRSSIHTSSPSSSRLPPSPSSTFPVKSKPQPKSVPHSPSSSVPHLPGSPSTQARRLSASSQVSPRASVAMGMGSHSRRNSHGDSGNGKLPSPAPISHSPTSTTHQPPSPSSDPLATARLASSLSLSHLSDATHALRLARAEIAQLRSENRAVEERAKAADHAAQRAEHRAAGAEHTAATAAEEIAQWKARAEEARGDAERSEEAADRAREEARTETERRRALEEQCTQLELAAHRENMRADAAERERDKLAGELDASRTAVAELTARIDQAQTSNIREAELIASRDAALARCAGLELRVAGLEGEMEQSGEEAAEARELVMDAERRCGKMEGRVKVLEGELEGVKAEVEASRRKVERAYEEAEQARSERHEAREELSEVHQELEQVKADLAQAQTDFSAIEERCEALEERVARAEREAVAERAAAARERKFAEDVKLKLERAERRAEEAQREVVEARKQKDEAVAEREEAEMRTEETQKAREGAERRLKEAERRVVGANEASRLAREEADRLKLLVERSKGELAEKMVVDRRVAELELKLAEEKEATLVARQQAAMLKQKVEQSMEELVVQRKRAEVAEQQQRTALAATSSSSLTPITSPTLPALQVRSAPQSPSALLPQRDLLRRITSLERDLAAAREEVQEMEDALREAVERWEGERSGREAAEKAREEVVVEVVKLKTAVDVLEGEVEAGKVELAAARRDATILRAELSASTPGTLAVSAITPGLIGYAGPPASPLSLPQPQNDAGEEETKGGWRRDVHLEERLVDLEAELAKVTLRMLDAERRAELGQRPVVDVTDDESKDSRKQNSDPSTPRHAPSANGWDLDSQDLDLDGALSTEEEAVNEPVPQGTIDASDEIVALKVRVAELEDQLARVLAQYDPVPKYAGESSSQAVDVACPAQTELVPQNNGAEIQNGWDGLDEDLDLPDSGSLDYSLKKGDEWSLEMQSRVVEQKVMELEEQLRNALEREELLEGQISELNDIREHAKALSELAKETEARATELAERADELELERNELVERLRETEQTADNTKNKDGMGDTELSARYATEVDALSLQIASLSEENADLIARLSASETRCTEVNTLLEAHKEDLKHLESLLRDEGATLSRSTEYLRGSHDAVQGIADAIGEWDPDFDADKESQLTPLSDLMVLNAELRAQLVSSETRAAELEELWRDQRDQLDRLDHLLKGESERLRTSTDEFKEAQTTLAEAGGVGIICDNNSDSDDRTASGEEDRAVLTMSIENEHLRSEIARLREDWTITEADYQSRLALLEQQLADSTTLAQRTANDVQETTEKVASLVEDLAMERLLKGNLAMKLNLVEQERSTLEARVSRLCEEAEDAKTNYERQISHYRDDLTRKSTAWSVMESNLRDNVAILEQRLSEATLELGTTRGALTELADVQASFSELDARYSALQLSSEEEICRLRKIAEDARAQIAQLSADAGDERAMSSVHIANLEEQIAYHESRERDLTSKQLSVENELHDAKAEIERLRRAVDDAEKERLEVSRGLEIKMREAKDKITLLLREKQQEIESLRELVEQSGLEAERVRVELVAEIQRKDLALQSTTLLVEQEKVRREIEVRKLTSDLHSATTEAQAEREAFEHRMSNMQEQLEVMREGREADKKELERQVRSVREELSVSQFRVQEASALQEEIARLEAAMQKAREETSVAVSQLGNSSATLADLSSASSARDLVQTDTIQAIQSQVASLQQENKVLKLELGRFKLSESRGIRQRRTVSSGPGSESALMGLVEENRRLEEEVKSLSKENLTMKSLVGTLKPHIDAIHLENQDLKNLRSEYLEAQRQFEESFEVADDPPSSLLSSAGLDQQPEVATSTVRPESSHAPPTQPIAPNREIGEEDQPPDDLNALLVPPHPANSNGDITAPNSPTPQEHETPLEQFTQDVEVAPRDTATLRPIFPPMDLTQHSV
ncbi:hypothetical protein HDU93_008401 [Gonapodya sp. JEL0774]|nr:hypothetical protein HDU93_008401 [Gonapodya sp. JEL0774]